MFEGMAVLMTAFYTIQGDYFATVRLSGENDHGLSLIVLHTSGSNTEETKEYNFLGHEASPKIEVENRDMLIVLARRTGIVVASQVYEVDTTAVPQGYLLIPRGGFNILCEQDEQMRESEIVKSEEQLV